MSVHSSDDVATAPGPSGTAVVVGAVAVVCCVVVACAVVCCEVDIAGVVGSAVA